MITAIDTNILLDIFGGDQRHGPASARALKRCLQEGALVACDIVWAEAATAFDDAERFREAMQTLTVAFLPMTEAAAIKAAQVWQRYRSQGGGRDRIASDFLIGAHALATADRLLTRDRGFYRSYFRGLDIIYPGHGN